MIAILLKNAAEQLKKISSCPQLEAEILLAHILKVKKEFFHTWPEQKIKNEEEQRFLLLLQRRLACEPISYLTRHREFWSLDLIVTPDVLIPRPETELLVEVLLDKLNVEKAVVADLGTGSGAIALALASERPEWTIHATDACPKALAVARQNAERLGIKNILFHQGDWCQPLSHLKLDAIVSNPPYLKADELTYELAFEPRTALVAEEEGFRDLRRIIQEAKHYLKDQGLLLLEQGYNQTEKINKFFLEQDYTDIDVLTDLAGWERITIARSAKQLLKDPVFD